MSITQNTTKTEIIWTCNRRWKWTVVGLNIVTFILLLTLLLLVILWSEKRQSAFYQKENIVCIPCYELKWSGYEDLMGFEQRNESEMDYMTCCNLGSKVIDRLIHKHAYSKHNDHDFRDTRIISSLWDGCKGKSMNPQKPYVKMTGLNFTAMENDTEDIIRWNSTTHEGDVKPLDGKIFIKVPGYYSVFSNLKLQGPMTNSSMVHSHYVYLHSYYHGQLKPILENSQSFCQTTSANSETSSTVGAVFWLEKHDKLFVRSSHPQHLISSKYINGFGLYMI